jgi:hypothetical protein
MLFIFRTYTIIKSFSARTSFNGGWNIKINDEKTRAIYFCHQIRLPEATLTLNGRSILFANSVKYLGLIFYKKIKWRLQIGTVTTKAYIIFIRP